jgi:hypothetical protein
MVLAPLTGLPVGASVNADTPASDASLAASVTTNADNHTETVPGTGAILDVAPAPDGGTYLVGGTAPEAPNLTVTRLDRNGSVVWQRSYEAANASRVGRSVAATDEAIYVVETVGPVRSATTPPTEPPRERLLQLDTNGSVVWTRSLGNATFAERGGLVGAPDGGVVLARPTGTRDRATSLLRVAADGTVAWNRTYEGGRPRSLAVTDDGGYLVGGQFGYDEGWVLGVAPNGSVELNVTLGGYHERRVAGVTATDDGGALLVGDAGVRGFGEVDPWAARVDADGAVRWSRTYPAEPRVRARAAVATGAGLLAVHDLNGEFGERGTRLTHVTPMGAVGTASVEGERFGAVPRLLEDGTVRLYGTRYNRTGTTPETFEIRVTGTVSEATLPSPTARPLDAHAGVTTNHTAYRGQNLRLDATDDTTFELLRLPGEYTEFDEPRLVRRLTTANGSVTFETATLESGRYAVRTAPNFWAEMENGSTVGITGNESAVAFEVRDRRLRFDYRPGDRPRPGPSDGPGFDDRVVETFDGGGVVEAAIEAEGESFTARVGLTRLNGSSPTPDELRAALAADPQFGGMQSVGTFDGRPYGTVAMPADGDRNLTLNVSALPAGLYRVSVTADETFDATEPATDQVVVVHEERDVRVVPTNETLTLPADGSATTNVTLSGAEAGLRAFRVEANRTGSPSVSLNLDLARTLEYRSASGGGGMGGDHSSAHAESLEIVSSPNGSFTIATLRVEARRFGDETPRTGNNTITLGPAYAVDRDGVPYSLDDSVTLTYTVTEAQNATDTDGEDGDRTSESSTRESGRDAGSASGSTTVRADGSGGS